MNFGRRGWKEVAAMLKTNKMLDRDLKFVRKYCLGGSYPASSERCPHAKAKIWATFSTRLTGNNDAKEVDAMFLCLYPDEAMPLHAAHLISELSQCPNMQRRKEIDGVPTKSSILRHCHAASR
jgi:hypothetical protein